MPDRIRRSRRIAALTLAVAAFSTMAFVGEPSLPDAALTPGAVATTSTAEVCAHPEEPGSAYSRAHRHTTVEMKRDVAHAYGMPRGASWHGVEFDHRVPLCDGGADTITNLWPEPWAEARIKDRLEAATCRAVCAGRITLHRAQAIFLGDWRPYLGTEP